MNFFLQNKPFLLQAANGSKTEEHFGSHVSNDGNIAISHKTVPAGWAEPHFEAETDIWTLVNTGKKIVEINGYVLVLEAGQSMLIKQGTRIRYSNPFAEACDYWVICMPGEPNTIDPETLPEVM